MHQLHSFSHILTKEINTLLKCHPFPTSVNGAAFQLMSAITPKVMSRFNENRFVSRALPKEQVIRFREKTFIKDYCKNVN